MVRGGMVMKSSKLTVLVVLALISTSAWAIWDPDADSALLFNMNFQTYNNSAHTTTDAKAGMIGTLVDYNTVYPNVFGETSRTGLGVDANFAGMHDTSPGAGVDNDGVASPNDVKLTVPSVPAFQLGYLSSSKHTWTFWFNVPDLNHGTIIRHASAYLQEDAYKDLIWEIRIFGGKMQFYHKNNTLRMETDSTLKELGLTENTWYHAAVVIDGSNSKETLVPTTQLSTKIYIDGLEVPVIVTSLNTQVSMNIDNDPFYPSPLWIGAGEREFDGLLDEVRLFSRALTAQEISILNQPDKTLPIALLPIPRSSNVVIATGLSWSPATGSLTAQSVYFGTDSNNLAFITSGNSSLSSVSNTQIGGPLQLNTKYYWFIRSTIGGVDSDGPLWSFTTETGKALNPSPYDGEEDINNADINLVWTTPTAGKYSVYVSTTRSLVDSNSVSVRIASDINDQNIIGFDPCNIGGRGMIYYWRVNSKYGSNIITGDIWSFRTKPYEIVFNTSGDNTTYADHVIPAYGCEVHGDGWTSVTTGSFDNGIAVFNFPSGFNYDRRYDIIVVPSYRATDINSIVFPTPLAIHAAGDFNFDGRIQLGGDDILSTTQDNTFTCSGGYPGPKHNQDVSIFPNPDEHPATVSDFWTQYTALIGTHRRLNSGITSDKSFFVPTDIAKYVFGPGQPANPPYKGGGGGGSGGAGGESGRGWELSIYAAGGLSYGDKEIPFPFGGSAGGWGGDGSPGGAAGGGGIEIVATGNVILDVNSQIIAHGGSQNCSATQYPAGGAGGGSVKIIAGGSVTLKGSIDVNGGTGGNNSNNKSNDTGGGGGGGRVAVFYGTTYSNTGKITAYGGKKGMNNATNPPTSLAQSGADGTIYTTNSSPKKASAPTPKNGDSVYCHPDPCTIKLKWYSGYGGTTDVIYCDNNATPTTSRGSASVSRLQHDVNMTVTAGKTYYVRVITDGTVISDTWSFKTTNWSCVQYTGGTPHFGGPEWDVNHDCVLDFYDYTYFASIWRNPDYNPAVGLAALGRFVGEWLNCINRTDAGCSGW
jgi:hypothetical protein